jgi:hypothetical protein
VREKKEVVVVIPNGIVGGGKCPFESERTFNGEASTESVLVTISKEDTDTRAPKTRFGIEH